jgi:hypothetical protein
MSWLQGGPFLEISLIIKEDNVRQIITKLSNLNNISVIEDNLEDLIDRFETGYLYDEYDKTSQRIHSLSLNIIVNIQGKRKSLLFLNQVAEQTILMDFCFYGSEFDAPEWGQIGIKEDEHYSFNKYLSELLEYFQGIVGTVAIENDVLGLISENHCWPDNVFSYKAINSTEFLERGIRKKYIGVGIRKEGKIKVTSLSSNS